MKILFKLQRFGPPFPFLAHLRSREPFVEEPEPEPPAQRYEAPPALTEAMRNAMTYNPETCAWVVRIITKKNGTAYLSNHPLSLSDLAAQVYPWASRLGSFQAKASGWANGLQASTYAFEVRDLDLSFTELFGSDFRDDLVDVLLVSDLPTITVADYAVMWAGRIEKAVAGGVTIEFACRSRDKELTVPVPRSSITKFSFRNLPDGSREINNGQQALFGTHSAEGYAGDNGMVLALLVDADVFLYLCAAGRIPVDRVYSANVLMVVGTDYSIVYRLSADLRLGTYIQFVVAQGDNEVSFDATGFTSNGEALGPLVDTPSPLLSLLLNLFGYKDWRSGAYPTGAPLSAAHLTVTENFLTALGHKAAYFLSGRRDSGIGLVEQFAKTFQLRTWWTLAGELAVAPLDHRMQGDDVYRGPGAPNSAFENDIVLDVDASMKVAPVPTFDDQGLAQAARVRIGYSARTGQYQHERVVSVGELGEERLIEGRFSPASPLSGEYIYDLKTDGDGTPIGYNIAPTSLWQRLQLADGPDGVTVNGPYTAVSNNTSADCDWANSHETLPDMASIRYVEVRARVKAAMVGGTVGNYFQLGLKIGGVVYPFGGSFSLANSQVQDLPLEYVWIAARFTKPPDTPGIDWTTTKINNMFSYGRYHPVGDNGEIDQVILRVSGFPSSVAFSPLALDIGSRCVWRFREQFEGLACKALPLRFAGLELLSFLSVAWRRRGWEDPAKLREPYAVTGRTINLDTDTVDLLLEPLRGFLTTFALDARATRDAIVDTFGQGIMLITAGATLTATGGATCVEHPAGLEVGQDGPIVRTVLNSFPFGRRGLAAHGPRQQVIDGAAFRGAAAGWNLTAGSGGAVVAADETLDYQLFTDEDDTECVLRFKAGAPHAVDSTADSADVSVQMGDTGVVQIWRRDINGAGPMAWRLWDHGSGDYYDDDAQAWGPIVDNVLPVTAVMKRFDSSVFTVPGGLGTTDFRLTLVQPAGGAAGRESIVGYAGMDMGTRWPGPPNPRDTAPLLARNFRVTNDCPEGVKTWPPKRATWKTRVRPWWNAADAAGYFFTVWQLFYDGNNLWNLKYVVGSGWRARAKAGGFSLDLFVEGPAGPPTRNADILLEFSFDTNVGFMTLRVTDAVGSASGSVPYTDPIVAPGGFFDLGSDFTVAGSGEFEGDIVTIENSPLPTDLA